MRTLYTVPTANGQRASVALEECGIDYAVRQIDFAKGEHRSDEVLALNPIGRLPILSDPDDDLVVYGSLAITRWAAARSPTRCSETLAGREPGWGYHRTPAC